MIDILKLLFFSNATLLFDPAPLLETSTWKESMRPPSRRPFMCAEFIELLLIFFVELIFPVWMDTLPVLLLAVLLPVFAVSNIVLVIAAF